MDGCPTTEWCRVSFWMVKLSRTARPNARRSSEPCSERTVCTPREGAPSNGFYVTDAVCNTRSSIGRVSEHHMIPAEVCDGQDPVRST